MGAEDEFVRRIVTQAGVSSAQARRELERELRAHLEDAAEAADIEDPGDGRGVAICRFGDPDEVGLQLRHLYRFDRMARSASETFLLILISVIAVAALIAIPQAAVAFSLGSAAMAPRRLPQQIVSIVMLVVGYMGTYLGYRVFRGRRGLKVFALDSAFGAALLAICLWVPRLDPTVPLLTLGIGACVRTLQSRGLHRVWVLATFGPVMAAALFSGRLISAGNELPLWGVALLRSAGLTAACQLLTWLSRNHQARSAG